jgi:hypothetical protein
MRFHNEQTRELTGHLSGRGLCEDMLGWETAEQARTEARELELARVWKAIPKVVFSTSLTAVEGNARPARMDVADEVAELKNQPARASCPSAVPGSAPPLPRKTSSMSTGCS